MGRARPQDIPQNNVGRRWFTKDPRRVPQLAGTALPEEVVVQVVEEVQHLAILWPFDGALWPSPDRLPKGVSIPGSSGPQSAALNLG